MTGIDANAFTVAWKPSKQSKEEGFTISQYIVTAESSNKQHLIETVNVSQQMKSEEDLNVQFKTDVSPCTIYAITVQAFDQNLNILSEPSETVISETLATSRWCFIFVLHYASPMNLLVLNNLV